MCLVLMSWRNSGGIDWLVAPTRVLDRMLRFPRTIALVSLTCIS